MNLTDQQISSLGTKRIFFGHQSVGDNIIAGIRDLAAADPQLKLNIVQSANPELYPTPVLVEAHMGRNGDPRSKLEAFSAILEQGMGMLGGLAMFKYCYVDIDPSTNIRCMFQEYYNAIAALQLKFPLLKIVHITVPLTTVELAPKAWLRTALGRVSARALNAKRHEFNLLLRATYDGVQSLFDLAKVESTNPDGSQSSFKVGSTEVSSLSGAYTMDGRHLNEAGRRAAAGEFLRVIAGAP